MRNAYRGSGIGIRLAVGLAVAFCSTAASAQAFPSKPIRLVVPFGPVGLPDVLARVVAENISASVGQSVIVENKPGAGGVIAAQYVAQAAPDGYTVLLTGTDYLITPAIQSRLPYDPERSFAAVTQAVRSSLFLVVNANLGVKSVGELIALAKQKPGVINYGSPGNGSLHHLAMEQFKLSAQVDLMHVPYKGVNQATPALAAGDISAMFVTLPSVVPFVKSGALRILAVGSAQRSQLKPELPTIAESGLSDFSVESTMGFVVPAGTPRPVIDKLNAEIAKALNTPDARAKLANLDAEVVLNTPEVFEKLLRTEQQRYAQLVKRVQLKID